MNRKGCIALLVASFIVAICGCANKHPAVPVAAANLSEPSPPIKEYPVKAAPPPSKEPVREVTMKKLHVESVPEYHQAPITLDESSTTKSPEKPKALTSSKYSTKQIDKIVDGFEQGSFAFKAPLSMDIRDPPATVTLEISSKLSKEEIRKVIGAKETEQAESGTIEISNNVEATLSSSDFDVILQSKNPQLVSSGKVFTWEWTIKPKKVEKTMVGKLHLDVSTTLDEGVYVLHTLNKEISITISKVDQGVDVVKSNWEYLKWAWGAVLVPVFGFIWKKYTKNGNVKPNDGG